MLLDLFGCQLRMPVEILLVLLGKDGMAMAVLKLLALLAPSTMVQNASAQVLKSTTASHGSILMEFNVFTSLNNVLLAHNGTKLLVYL